MFDHLLKGLFPTPRSAYREDQDARAEATAQGRIDAAAAKRERRRQRNLGR